MKFLLGFVLTMGSLCGMAIGFLGQTKVSLSLFTIDGLDISMGVGVFSLFCLLSGIYLISLSGSH